MLVILFFITQLMSGVFAIRFFDPERRMSLPERMVAGGVAGMLFSTYAVLVCAIVFSSLPLAIGFVAAASMISFLLVFVRRFQWAEVRRLTERIKAAKHTPRWPFIIMLTVAGILIALEIQVFLPSPPFYAGILVGWGDVALHLDIIERLATADPFFIDHPVLAGHKLVYPFFGHFISSIYRSLGGGWMLAYHLPMLFFCVAGAALLYFWYHRISRRPLLASLLVVCAILGGGLGWIWFFQDASHAFERGGIGETLQTLGNLPHEYTHLDSRTGGKPSGLDAPHNIVWMVPAISFLSHQRSFPVGLAAGIFVLLGIWHYRKTRHLWRYGAVLGLLPIIHIHTFVAMGVIIAAFMACDLKRWKEYVRLGLVTALIGLPFLAYLLYGRHSSLRWWFGWMTCTHNTHWLWCDTPPLAGTDTSVLWFWTKNFGVIFLGWTATLLATTLAPLMKWKQGARLREHPEIFIASLLLFVLPNVFIFQAWEFDNNKIFFWWWIMAIAAVGYAFSTISSRRIHICLLGLLIPLTISAGVLDVSSRFLHFQANHFGYVGPAEIEAAQWIREHTPANARIITGMGANNFVPMLTGRSIAMGFEGWLWTEGADYLPRKRAIEAFARGNAIPACAEGLHYAVADISFYKDFSSSKQAVETAAMLVWSQNNPWGERGIYELKCPDIPFDEH